MTTTSLVPISQEDIAAVSGFQDRSLPIEQTCVWETFEKSQGHGVGTPRLAMTTPYLHHPLRVHGAACTTCGPRGPAWVKEASPEREWFALRADLVREIKERDKSVVFVRLHAIYRYPDLVMPLQTTLRLHRRYRIPGKTEDAILAHAQVRKRS